MTDIKKRIKSFNLKEENASKVEKIAYETRKRESHLVDEMIESYGIEAKEEVEDGNR